MNRYIVTFYTHYGAVRFDRQCRQSGIAVKMMPVPRKLSSSCGTCVIFEADSPSFVRPDEDLERCYLVKENNVYEKVDITDEKEN